MTHEAQANGVEYVKPISAAPREDRQIASKKRILFDHGFCKGLLCPLIATEKRFNCRGRVAVDVEAFPPTPCLDFSGERSKVLAAQRLCVERLLYYKNGWLICLEEVSQILQHLRSREGQLLASCEGLYAIPDQLLPLKDRDTEVLHPWIDGH